VTTFKKKLYAYATSEDHAIEQVWDAISWGIDGTLNAEKTVHLEDTREVSDA
jgi:hypothetical protein